jgi:predicted DNA-binding protein (MmcQ/YjbR family)
MNIEKFREYCLSKPHVTEDFPFDDDVLTFRICNKIFAVVSMSRPDMATMNATPNALSTSANNTPPSKAHSIGTKNIGTKSNSTPTPTTS